MKTLIFSLLLIIPCLLSAQKWEAGVFLGASNYSGDLTQGYMTLSETHPAIGGLIRYNLTDHFSLRLSGYYGTISGTDRNAKSSDRQLRNLSFRSRIYEAGLQGEWNIAPNRVRIWGNNFTPYVFGGVALFHFNPQAYYLGEWVDLQPLGTEGQNMVGYEDRQYSLFQVSLPFGLGFKYDVSEFISIGLEYGARKTFTDYLDDVSTSYVNNAQIQETSGSTAAALADRSGEVNAGHTYTPGDIRGNPETDDWYMFSGVNLTFKLFNNSTRTNQMDCPF